MFFREIFGSSNLVIATAGGALVYYGRCQANLDFLSIFSGIFSQDCISLQSRVRGGEKALRVCKLANCQLPAHYCSAAQICGTAFAMRFCCFTSD